MWNGRRTALSLQNPKARINTLNIPSPKPETRNPHPTSEWIVVPPLHVRPESPRPRNNARGILGSHNSCYILESLRALSIKYDLLKNPKRMNKTTSLYYP